MSEVWERQTGESNLWYSRFEQYRLLGPDRSVLKTYNQWRSKVKREKAKTTPGSWVQASLKGRWRERAESFDAWEREQQRQRYQAEVDRLFDHAQQATRLAYQKIISRLQVLDPNEIPAPVVVPQFLALVKKLEELFDRQSPLAVQVQVVSEEDKLAIRERIRRQMAQLTALTPGLLIAADAADAED